MFISLTTRVTAVYSTCLFLNNVENTVHLCVYVYMLYCYYRLPSVRSALTTKGGRDNIAYMHTQILIIYVHAGNMSGRNVLGPMEKCPMGKVEAGMSGVMSP